MEEKPQQPNNVDTPENEHNSNDKLFKVTQKLDELIDKLNANKKRDGWDRFQIVASFISSVLFAGVGLYFTTVYNNREAKRQADLQHAQLSREDREEKRQIEMQNVQKEITQLEAIIKLTPLLTSKDKETKRYALITLEALHKNNSTTNVSTDISNIKADDDKKDVDLKFPKLNPSSNLLNSFVQIALAENSTLKARNEAVKGLRDIAVNPNTRREDKEKATSYVTKIAAAENIPEETRNVASNYLKEIKSIPFNSIASEISKQNIKRKVDEIILHHTAIPGIEGYKGPQTIFSAAKFNIEFLKWSNVGWHYTISPDGLVWTGRPLETNWSGIGRGYTGEAVAIDLFINGDKELPTEEQKRSLGILLNTLCKKFKIIPSQNFSKDHGFHRDYSKQKSCPGNLITKEMILQLMEDYGK